MAEKQLSMYDCLTPVPPMCECRETCKRFGEWTDSPDWWHGEVRCLLPNTFTMRQVEFDNRAYIWCTLYERKDDNA